MAHDVFISYSSKDKPIADGVCANLEAAGIRCWMAPRDIAPGEDWPTAIATAISLSRIMVLVFSANSNSSADVGRELILASNSNLVIIPFKIENIQPEPGKQYYLARTHWLDAMNPPTREQITILVNRVKSIFPATGPAEPDRAIPTSPPPKPAQKESRPRLQNILLLGGLIALGIFAGFFFIIRYIEQINPSASTPTLTTASTLAPSSVPALTHTIAPALVSNTSIPVNIPTVPNKTQVVVFSDWIVDDTKGLNALLKILNDSHPDIQFTDPWASFSCAGCEVQNQMLSGNPPDSFQTPIGQQFIDAWVIPGYMEPLDDVFAQYGLNDAFPKSILGFASYNGHPWSVPVNIRRNNVVWYNKAIFEKYGVQVSDIETFAGWEAAARKFKAAGISPLALGDSSSWTAALLFEDVLAGTLGADKYLGLWTGTTNWNGPEVKQALENFKMMLQYVNTDHASLTWYKALRTVIDGKAAMTVIGDWANGALLEDNATGYAWTETPGTKSIYVAVADSYGIPKNAKHPEAMKELLDTLGSKSGQEAFNRYDGSLCARTDCDYSKFSAYQKSAAVDLSQDTIVPSVIQGVATNQGWSTAFDSIISAFVAGQDVKTAQSDLAQACMNAGVCQ